MTNLMIDTKMPEFSPRNAIFVRDSILKKNSLTFSHFLQY